MKNICRITEYKFALHEKLTGKSIDEIKEILKTNTGKRLASRYIEQILERKFDLVGTADTIAQGIAKWLHFESTDLYKKYGNYGTGEILNYNIRKGHFFIKEKNHQKVLEGEYAPNKSVLLLTTMIEASKDVLDMCQLIEQYNMKVNLIISVIDNLKGGEETLRKRGYDYYSLLTTKDLSKKFLGDYQISDLKHEEDRKAIAQLSEKFKSYCKIGLDKNNHVSWLQLGTSRTENLWEEINKLSFLKCLTLFIKGSIKFDKLDGLTELQSLSVLSQGIEKIENLEPLTKLKKLRLKGSIRHMEGLENLTKLAKLNLCLNHIFEINGLENQRNLINLDLSTNRINSISNLDELKNLRILKLNWNRIYKIERLDNLTNLEYLNLSSNGITKVEGIEKLKNLRQIDLHNNPVRELVDLSYLPKLNRPIFRVTTLL